MLKQKFLKIEFQKLIYNKLVQSVGYMNDLRTRSPKCILTSSGRFSSFNRVTLGITNQRIKQTKERKPSEAFGSTTRREQDDKMPIQNNKNQQHDRYFFSQTKPHHNFKR